MSPNIRWLCLAWAPYSRRNQVFAKSLGGTHHCVHYLRFQTPIYAPVKYALQAIRSFYILSRERPRVVYVQTPPVFCGMVVDFYCRWHRARFVLDHHSAIFARKWRWALPLQKFLARRAMTNIVTNSHWAEVVHDWGANALVMGDPFLPLPEGKPYPLKTGFNIVFVGTFGLDEPIDAVVEAVRGLENVNLYITGYPHHRPKSFFQNLPPHVRCTGFLPNEQYVGLLQTADAIMALTTRDHTLQLGGCEAVSSAKPLITSDWPFLKEFFFGGTVYVKNTPDGIQEGILFMMRNYQRLASEIFKFRDNGRKIWNEQFAELNNLIQRDMNSGKKNGRKGRKKLKEGLTKSILSQER